MRLLTVHKQSSWDSCLIFLLDIIHGCSWDERKVEGDSCSPYHHGCRSAFSPSFFSHHEGAKKIILQISHEKRNGLIHSISWSFLFYILVIFIQNVCISYSLILLNKAPGRRPNSLVKTLISIPVLKTIYGQNFYCNSHSILTLDLDCHSNKIMNVWMGKQI